MINQLKQRIEELEKNFSLKKKTSEKKEGYCKYCSKEIIKDTRSNLRWRLRNLCDFCHKFVNKCNSIKGKDNKLKYLLSLELQTELKILKEWLKREQEILEKEVQDAK